MFAYCNNNPVNSSDPTGESLIAAAAIGGAIGGAIFNAALYCSTTENASIEGAILAAIIGGATGALGGAAGVMSTTSSKVFLTAAASAISGLYSYYTGNSGFVGLSTGAVGTRAYLKT